MARARLPVLLAAAALAAACSSARELTGAAAARSRGAAVTEVSDAPPLPQTVDPLTDYARVLARVNGKVITLREIRHIIGPTYEMTLDQRELLVKLIEARTRERALKQVVLDEAEKLGIAVTDEEMKRDFERQEEIAAKKGTTIEQTLIDLGITRQEWDRQRRESKCFEYATGHFSGHSPEKYYRMEWYRPSVDVYVGPGEVREWGEAHRALVMDLPEAADLRIIDLRKDSFGGPDAPEAERWRLCGEAADAALARVRAGEDFADVAREVSQGPEAAAGGLLKGVTRASELRQEFLDFAFDGRVKPGELSRRIRIPTGHVVLLLEARNEARTLPIEEWAPLVQNQLRALRSELVFNEVLIRLLEEAAVSPREFRDSLHASLQEKARQVRDRLR